MMTTSVMIVYPAISPLTGDRHAPELVIGMAGLGDRHRPDSLIDFTGIRIVMQCYVFNNHPYPMVNGRVAVNRFLFAAHNAK
jgi:hypothetical protein